MHSGLMDMVKVSSLLYVHFSGWAAVIDIRFLPTSSPAEWLSLEIQKWLDPSSLPLKVGFEQNWILGFISYRV